MNPYARTQVMNAAESLREQYTNRGPHNKGWSQAMLKEAVKGQYQDLNIAAFKTAIKSLLERGKLEKVGSGNANYHFPKGYKHLRSAVNTPMPSPSKSQAKKASPSMKKKTATKATARKSTAGKASGEATAVTGKKRAAPKAAAKKVAAKGKGKGKGAVAKKAAPKTTGSGSDNDTGEGSESEGEDGVPEMEGIMPTDMDMMV